jgi:hypothetical protein
MIDLEGIEDHLSYDPETGLFHWLRSAGSRAKGSVAGHLHSTGYVQVSYKGKRHFVHRLAFWFMEGVMPKECVDHINGVTEDNRWVNLREASQSENLRNMKPRGGASKYKGVTRNGNYWQARITSKELGQKHLGCFICDKEAALVYNYAALKHFGSFARFNQVFDDMPTTDRVSIH